MKIKSDFVTNSSSTSFIVWGVSFDEDDLVKNKELLETVFNRWKDSKYFPGDLTLKEFQENFYDYRYEIQEFITQGTILEASFGSDGDGPFMIGASPENMKDNQTLKEFKDQIISEINKMGFEVKKLNFIAESWFDG